MSISSKSIRFIRELYVSWIHSSLPHYCAQVAAALIVPLSFYLLWVSVYSDVDIALFGDEFPLSSESWRVVLWLVAALSLYLVCYRRSYLSSLNTLQPSRVFSHSLVATTSLAVVIPFISSILDREFGYFQGRGVVAEMVLLGVILTVLLYLRSLYQMQDLNRFWTWFILLAQIGCSLCFLSVAKSRLLFSDDHPSFLYRLHLLREHFPFIPFYNSDWNAGYSAREFFPSGVLNVFSVSFPFLYLAPSFARFEDAFRYNYLIPYIFIFLVPWSVYVAARIFKVTHRGACIAALFALGPSMAYFEWLLKYGNYWICFFCWSGSSDSCLIVSFSP